MSGIWRKGKTKGLSPAPAGQGLTHRSLSSLFFSFSSLPRRRSSVTAATAASTSRPFVAIENIELIDVVQGKVSGPRTVLLGGGRIAAIIEPGTAVGLPSNAVAIDGRGKFLIPGLTDMHVHLFNNATHR